MNSIDVFLSILKSLAKRQNRSYRLFIEKENKKIIEDIYISKEVKEALIRPLEDSPQYLDVIDFINRFKNIELSDVFKDNLIILLNKYSLYNFSEHWMSNFYLVRDVVNMNLAFKYQYNVLSLPFGDKKDKYEKRINTIKKQNKKDKQKFVLLKISPFECIKFFQNKCIKVHLKHFDFCTESKTKREKIKERNDLIFELCKLSVCDNYHRNLKKLRISNEELYENEMNKVLKSYR